MSHTPGPWRVIKCQQKEYRCVAFSKKRGELYATSPLLPGDARLIAAAPTLVDLLQAAAAELTNLSNEFNRQSPYALACEIDATLTAIAKATK